MQTPPPPAPPQGGRGGGGRRDDPVNADVDWSPKPPLLAKTPEEQLKLFLLQPGYRLELVLSDPLIQEPTAIAFDGNGRMFVVEDRSYMLDLDMTGQLDPISRISMHVDADGDGVYEQAYDPATGETTDLTGDDYGVADYDGSGGNLDGDVAAAESAPAAGSGGYYDPAAVSDMMAMQHETSMAIINNI